MYVQYPKGRRELGRWYFSFGYAEDFVRMESHSRRVHLSIFKPVRRPPEGAEFGKRDYKGFIFSFRFLVPVIVDRWR